MLCVTGPSHMPLELFWAGVTKCTGAHQTKPCLLHAAAVAWNGSEAEWEGPLTWLAVVPAVLCRFPFQGTFNLFCSLLLLPLACGQPNPAYYIIPQDLQQLLKSP